MYPSAMFSLLALLAAIFSLLAFIFAIALFATAHARFHHDGIGSDFGPAVRIFYINLYMFCFGPRFLRNGPGLTRARPDVDVPRGGHRYDARVRALWLRDDVQGQPLAVCHVRDLALLGPAPSSKSIKLRLEMLLPLDPDERAKLLCSVS